MADTVPTSHFFIQSPSTLTQTVAQGFGPSSATEFNVTSRFAFTAKTKAFAVCKGLVLVQPNGTNLVNVILKPYKQPIPGLNIKYFVYRGLSKDEFFTTATSPTVIPKTPTTSIS